MTLVQHFAPTISPHRANARYRLRTSPRLALGSGERVGATIRFPASVPVPVALELACGLVRSSSLLVSVAITPPFHDVPGFATAALVQSGARADRLELTVSRIAIEQAGIEALLALSAMRDQGIGIALRGFAARTAALLPRLPLSGVIFAPGAIRNVPGGAASIASFDALLQLAHNQGLRTVATGIETEAQRAVLSGLGCNAGEGSLFGTAVQTRAAA